MNIAKVLDAGTTETGRPYFVMELVNGIPITGYCDQYQLSTEQRLHLRLGAARGRPRVDRVDLEQELAPAHRLPLLHGEPHDLARHVGRDVHLRLRTHLPAGRDREDQEQH